jgi:hypothetical protein
MPKRVVFLDMDGVLVNLPEGRSVLWGEVDFWRNLPKYPWADDLVAAITAGCKCYILTSIGGGACSATGKIQWLQNHYPELAKSAILTRRKEMLAAPGRVLIDDDPGNCQKWVERGGWGILFPHPRNAEYKNFCTPDGFSSPVDPDPQSIIDTFNDVAKRNIVSAALRGALYAS